MRHLLSLLCLLFGHLAFSQQSIPAMGGGEYLWQPTDHISEEEYARIIAKLKASTSQLAAEGKLNPADRSAQVQFEWPLNYVGSDPGYYGISNYIDHNEFFSGANNDSITDYQCGLRSYDTGSGYNHRGTDIFTWPFSWAKMANDEVEVVAAAPGTIILKQDGNPDMSCAFCTGCSWNAVYIRHDDGTVAWYGHLKTNSTTSKGVGDTIASGEYLGILGSSGNSTGPHLHFEVWADDTYTQLIDPWVGPCNPTTNTSWWSDQAPYRDSRINALTTGTASIDFGNCPDTAVTSISSNFDPGDQVFLTAFYQDQLQNVSSLYRIYDPNGQLWDQWTHSSSVTYNASWWWWNRSLPLDAETGEWSFEVRFSGQTVTKPFYVGSTTSTKEVIRSRFAVSPNPFGQIIHIQGLENEEEIEYALFDMYGRLLQQGACSGSIELKNREIENGVYFLTLSQDGSNSSYRIIRQSID